MTRKLPECETCNKHCCVYEVHLTASDIIRLSNYLNISKDKVFEFIDSRGILKKTGDYCRFFNEESKLCTIYEHRPEACRYYICNNDEEVKYYTSEDIINEVSGYFSPETITQSKEFFEEFYLNGGVSLFSLAMRLDSWKMYKVLVKMGFGKLFNPMGFIKDENKS